jgi:predicted DNA-binding protein with PD1-like motif
MKRASRSCICTRLGGRGSATIGGHLMQARVRPTLEVIVTESPAHLRRVHDEQSGLALIRP